MGKNKTKKQFINKKTAHKFTLVHRSQRDPLQADDEAGQHVLMPIDGAEDHSGNDSNKIEENVKHGIYFDDGYDYMQHLRPRGEGMLVYADGGNEPGNSKGVDVSFGNVKLPADAFASTQEEDIGLLNKGVLPRGPQPDWDPEIVEALDDGVDFDDPDNFLEDDFIMKANEGFGTGGDDGGLSEGMFSEMREQGGDDDDEWETDSEGGYISSDNLLSDEEDEFAREETKSRFTSYSMTSSVIRRTEGLKVLDDHFERIMEEYDEEELGCIDQEEVQGVLNTDNVLVNSVIDSYYEENKKHDLSETKDDEDGEKIDIDEEDEQSSEEEDDEKVFEQFKTEPKEKWDCESILSTYSNIYNHPKLIKEESKVKKFELHKRTGIPLGVFDDPKQILEQVDDESDIDNETVVINNIRNKDETPDERKQRKKEVKEQRKNRRAEKKANKMAFKHELKKQEKINKNTVVQKGIKL